MPGTQPYKIKALLRYFVRLVMWFFVRWYRIGARLPVAVKKISGPYLLLANHYGRYDPFILSYFIARPPNFISSDAILRDWPVGAFFRGLGAIPKKRGIRDTQVVRDMLKVIRQGGALALFPEGTRTWAGNTLYIDPAVAKLARLLQVPVITARMQGAYAFDPRWAAPLRRARVVIDYELTLSAAEVQRLDEETIYRKICQRLEHHDINWQREQRVKIRSSRRAEHIEKILFQCPMCLAFDGFDSCKNRFACRHCRQVVEVDEYGFFHAPSLPFDNPYDWFYWQAGNFIRHIHNRLAGSTAEPLFKARGMKMARAEEEGRMTPLGNGDLLFYADRLVIEPAGCSYTLEHGQIDYLGPQYMERLELFCGNQAWRFVSSRPFEAGVKWELAINTVWAVQGRLHKLSPYWKERVLGITGTPTKPA